MIERRLRSQTRLDDGRIGREQPIGMDLKACGSTLNSQGLLQELSRVIVRRLLRSNPVPKGHLTKVGGWSGIEVGGSMKSRMKALLVMVLMMPLWVLLMMLMKLRLLLMLLVLVMRMLM